MITSNARLGLEKNIIFLPHSSQNNFLRRVFLFYFLHPYYPTKTSVCKLLPKPKNNPTALGGTGLFLRNTI
jgi:hypothetical protein